MNQVKVKAGHPDSRIAGRTLNIVGKRDAEFICTIHVGGEETTRLTTNELDSYRYMETKVIEQ